MTPKERYEKRKKASSTSTPKERYEKKQQKKQQKKQYESTINFDTLNTDLETLGTTIQGAYEGWQPKETMNNTKSSIESMYNRLLSVKEYRNTYGITKGDEEFNGLVEGYKSILDGWDGLSQQYGQYQDANSYNNAQKEANKYLEETEKAKTDDLDAVRAEIADMEEEYAYWDKQASMIPSYEGVWTIPYSTDWKNPNEEITPNEFKDRINKIKQIEEKEKSQSKYAGYTLEEYKAAIEEKKAYLNRATVIQNNLKIKNDARNDVNYDAWSQEGMSYPVEDVGVTFYSASGDASGNGMGIAVTQSESTTRQAARAMEKRKKGEEHNYENVDSPIGEGIYVFMTDDEFKDFAYYLKYDKENNTTQATQYLKSIEEDLNQRYGTYISDKYKDRSALAKVLYGIPAGLDQFESGVKNALIFTDDYIPTTSTQYAAQNIRASLYDTGFDLPKWLGGTSFGQTAFDLVNTTSNMAIPMAVGGITNIVAPGSGTYVTAGLMGLSASGNAYQQMLNQGYDKKASRTYATLVGASEAGLSALLSGMIGGKGTEKAIEKIIQGIDNGFFRFAVRWGMSGLSEIPEESLQTLLEPMFQNIALGYEKNKWEDTDWSQVAYDGLLGGISGLGLGGGTSATNTIREQSGWKNAGNNIRNNERIPDMMGIAELLPQEYDAYDTYTRYANKGINADNITDVQLGRLYSEIDNDTTSILESKKSTSNQMSKALETKTALALVSTENTEVKARKRAEELAKPKENGVAISDTTKIEGIKDNAIVTSEGEVSLDNAELSETNAELVARAETIAKTMGEDVANVFLAQYDAKTNGNVSGYADSFNLAMEYSVNNYTQETLLEHKGVLTESQVGAIYTATVKASYMAQENAKNEITKKHSQKVFLKGTFNDSIIDYNSKTTDGSKVNWNSLTSTQRSAIKFAQLFSKATGVNIRFIKSDVVNGKHKGKNGSYDPSTNTIEIDVYAGRIDANTVKDSIIPTLSHELTHWMKAKSPAIYNSIREDVMKTLAEKSGFTTDELVAKEMARMKAAHPDMKVTPEGAIDELVARACEDMLSNSNEARKLLNKMSAKEQQSFIEKVKEIFENLIQWVNDLLARYKSDSNEAKILQEYKYMLKKISKQWDAMLVDAIKTNQALQHEGINESDIIGKDVAAHKLQFNERLIEKHIDMLENNYSEESTLPLETLLARYNKIAEMWKRLGGELNSQFLEDWNNKVGTDRTFSVFKAQAGYKYNVELSSMCKKGIPLFEAIDKIVKDEAMKELRTKNLGKAEKEILYDILKENNFDIPCAICYVEQARQSEGKIIDAFLNGFVEKSPTGKTLQFKLGWNETLDNIQKEMKAAGFDYTFPSVDRSVATDTYSPADLTMDEETQEHFFEALKKVANKEIRRYNQEQNKGKPKKLITKTDAKSLNEVFKGKLPLNLMMFRTMFNEPSSRFKIDNDLLYSSMTTQNLAKNHNALYSVFNAQGGVGGYKTKQGTIIYWADILKKTWKPSKLRDEGGVRNQSNSDFLMYTLLDHAQMYIDFTAKGYYLQAYTKVLAELKLFGLSKGKINASFIPKVHVYRNADGGVDVEKTQLNAGLDENGNPIFDDIEGIPHDEAFMLVEDSEYSKNIGGVCIGYSDNHISKLLDDKRIQLIIGFHDKTNDTSKRYKGAVYATNYNSVNEATKYDSDGKLKTVHIGFNQFVRKAENKFKNNDTIEYNGKTYKYNDIPKLATDLYLEHCESKGLNPAYSQGGVDFSKHENYYKLLADFSLYDINGNYAPHQKVEYNMPDQVPYLDENGKKAYMPSEDYIKKELSSELKVRDAISEKLADKSENGIIPQFIERANALHDSKGTQYADRDLAPTFYSQMGKTIDEMKQDKIGANSVVSYLKGRGVKNEEIKWSGIETFLEGKKSVTKAELQEFVAGSMLQIEEDIKGYNETDLNDRTHILFNKIERAMPYTIDYFDMRDYINGKAIEYDNGNMTHEELEEELYETIFGLCADNFVPSEEYSEFDEWLDNSKEWTEITNALYDVARVISSETRWNKYKLDGGENYREITFKMPNSAYTNQAMQAHWGENAQGILAHARMQDFNVNGNKMLFIEEIQSDWHNEGHRQGYVDKSKEVTMKTTSVKHEDGVYRLYRGDQELYAHITDAMLETRFPNGITDEQIHQGLVDKHNNALPDAVPDAPFSTNYHEYVLKRLIRMAAEQGYDSIGWTTADIQSNRWSDQYAEGYRIEYDQDIPKFLNKYGKKWGAKVDKINLGKNKSLPGYDGDANAKRFTSPEEAVEFLQSLGFTIHSTENTAYGRTYKTYSILNPYTRYGTRYGVRQSDMMEEAYAYRKEGIREHGVHDVWSMDITDSMKDSVLHEGQVMYADRDYSYDALTSKPDMVIPQIANVPSNEISLYMGNRNLFAKEMIAIATKAGNSKNTNTATYLHCKDLNEDVQVTKNSFKHGAARMDAAYIAVCKNISNVLENSIVVNELKEKENTNGGYVLLGLAESEDSYIIVRSIVDKKTWKLEDYNELYAIRKKSIKKEDVGFIAPALPSMTGFGTSSTISITNFLKFVNNQKLANSVLSMDVINRLNSKREFDKNVTPNLLYSDRDNVSVYDKIGEVDKLIKENEMLKEDVEMLKERLKLEGKVTHGEYFNQNQLNAVAGHIRSLANSSFDKKTLASLIDGIYKYISHSEDLNWQDMFAQCYDVARMVLDEAKPVKVKNDYNEYVLKQISGSTLYANETQIKEAEYKYGKYWRNKLKGRFTITTNPNDTSIDRMWGDWSDAKKGYPNIFDANETDSSKLASLIDAVESLREATEIVQEYDIEEQTRFLAYEIYNKFWTVQPIRTTADRYTKQIKQLNFKHRQAMDKLRTDRDAKLQAQHKYDKQRANELYKNLRERKDREIAEVKKRGKERLDAYKENAERKTKIQSITGNALTLNKWLTKNSQKEHIHEAMKGPVIKLLQAIDFSSKQMLNENIPTQKDITFAKAFASVKEMLIKAESGAEGLIELYGHNLGEGIQALVDAADRIVGDNNYVINKMTLEELDQLDRLVKYIKKVVSDLNKFHTVNHANGIASLSQEQIEYADSLGKEKVFDPKTLKASVQKLIKWDNKTPFYAFKQLGKAAQKIFEAFQDGWDKLSFNAKQIIDFTKETYTDKEVIEWAKEIKTFDIQLPATDMDLANPDYKPKYKKVQMTVPQIMSLYCSMKREQAKNHILQGGIRVADITMKKGQLIQDAEGVTLTVSDINNIISTLTSRQKQVADALQKFMNNECAAWGNEVSMRRFGYKAFGEDNYFPIESDANNLSNNDAPQDNGNSLFKLLNMSFTKTTIEGANNRIVIKDIFDVFASHSSDMAKYNALALPVLDAVRWYNYTEKIETKDERFITKSVKASIENAFGKEGKNYIRTFLEDINGQKNVGRDTIGKTFFSRAKIVSVAANLRVALLQPTAYLKASAIIDTKYLAKAFMHKPKIKHAEKYCGMALWKSLGYYDTDISKGLTEQIKHAETWKDKAVEMSMKGAEIGDKITFGYLWNACELEIRDTRKDLKVGSEEFFDAVAKRLREVIYSTQVVDSTMTRSQLMRSGNMYEKMLTAFSSEPTLAFNMLQDAVTTARLEKRATGKVGKESYKKIARVFTAYTVTNVIAALIESGFDAFRDDDDEEMDAAKFMEYYLKNFATDMSIIGKIPYIKELVSIAQGFSSSRSDTQWMQTFSSVISNVFKMAQGNGNPSKLLKDVVKLLSFVSGLPFYNVYRDLMATLNKLDILNKEDLEEILDDLFG